MKYMKLVLFEWRIVLYKEDVFNMGCFDSGVEDEVKVANQIGIFDTASNK